MAASLHLARYTPRNAARMLRAMARHQKALDATSGLAAARVCVTAELDTLVGGTPTPTRWGLLCAWDDAQARDAFLADGAGLQPFASDASECWSVSLDAVRVVNGTWRGWTPSTQGVPRLRPDEPLAVLTYGKIRARHMPAFTWQNRKVVRELAPNPGHVMRIGLGDHLMARCTFSLWRSQGDVVRFAYGAGTHNPVQRRSLDAPWSHDFFFARFRPVAASGTWMGSDPLAAV